MDGSLMILLETKSIVKRFGGVTALAGADFSLLAGEVHVLLGANGCGKTTLCKVISGVISPDEGEVSLRGTLIQSITPRKSKEMGVGVVYQELSLIPDLSVADNILLGIEPVTVGRFIDKKSRKRKIAEIFKKFAPLFPENFSLETYLYKLTPDLRQLTEIMKVLLRDPEILIFDEPTASLSSGQVDLFFNLIGELKSEGKGIIFISHKMEEIFRIGNRITVMRGGRTLGCRELDKTNRDEIIELMVGESFEISYIRKSSDKGVEVLGAENLTGAGLHGIDFSLYKGEILGLGGLQGQGQREFLLTLFGVNPVKNGVLKRDGTEVSFKGPPDAMKASMAFISGDRKRYGIFLGRSILENLQLARINLMKKFFFSKKNLAREAGSVIDELELVYDKLDLPVSSLSGGNQQKVIIGRWLLNNPDVILMNDPTKGVDVKTKKELYELLGRMCSKGVSVIWNSSDDQELLQNADRILVFRDGMIVRELTGDQLTENALYRAALNVVS
jgi:ribose transport system ATP-binding protein